MKSKQIIFSLLLILLTANLIFGTVKYFEHKNDKKRYIRQFAEVIDIVQSNYVDESQIKSKDLIYNAIDGMLSNLDDYSSFHRPQEYSKLKEENAGQFAGIGVKIEIRKNDLLIIEPMPNSPGSEAGLLSNDTIYMVNGKSLEDEFKSIDKEFSRLSIDERNFKKLRFATTLIKGEVGTTVKLGIFRESENRRFDVDVIRGIIKLESVRNGHMIKKDILYVWITGFNNNTANELSKILSKNANLKGLIIDLRNNPGGLLETSNGVCNIFMPPGQLIVSTIPRNKKNEYRHYSDNKRKKYLDLALVILINGQSASGSEIVAGCLKDYKIATLVGETSYGKGSVQTLIPLGDKSALRLTTAKYYTPNKYVIHKKGVAPDVEVLMTKEQKLLFYKNINRYHLNKETIEDDPQLMKAIELVNEKMAARSKTQ
ncbi:MAG: S41 family peptidase [Lentisphaeria bacterium]|nr:S41 family peptidase [Lentisphaeria bacterium]NQZ68944.1 S41 family peptidase [Lentisphaeria bacterium]